VSPHQLNCKIHLWEFKIFVFEIYFDFLKFIIFWQHLIKTVCKTSTNKVG
jgi:hypothetical protein